MRAFYSDHFVLPLPPGHRFPMLKYRMVREQACARGILSADDLRIPEAAADEALLRVHYPDYLDKVVRGTLSAKEIRRLGFPWSEGLVERSRRSVGGTVGAAHAALEEGIALNLAGGTHHAHPGFGAGFCVFNDVAVAARTIQAEGLAERIAILDCDVHQGDGTAFIFAGDPTVFTLSIHGARNFPFRKQQSDLDIELDDGAGDDAYLDAVRSGVEYALDVSGAEMAFYLAGADPFAGDRLGLLAVSMDGLAARDRFVLEACRGRGLPVAITMAGGYARELQDIVDVHLQTIALAVGLAEML